MSVSQYELNLEDNAVAFEEMNEVSPFAVAININRDCLTNFHPHDH